MTKRTTIDKIDPQVMQSLREAIGPLVTDVGGLTLAGYLLAMADELECLVPHPVMGPNIDRYFDQAWGMWPVAGKRRSAKSKALAQFRMISRKIGPQALLDAINRFVLSPDVEKDDGAYTPALDRWLINRRWEVWLEDVAVKRVGFV